MYVLPAAEGVLECLVEGKRQTKKVEPFLWIYEFIAMKLNTPIDTMEDSFGWNGSV